MIQQQQKQFQQNSEKNLSFDDYLQKRIGIGKSQFLAALAAGMIWLTDGSEMFVVGFILPIIVHQWDISPKVANILGSVIFLGITIGALITSNLSDRIGRRKPLIISSIILFASSFLSILAPNFEILMFLRFFYGLGMGIGVPITAIYITELFPKNCRGKYFLYMGQFFPLGSTFVILIAWISFQNFFFFIFFKLELGNWRILLFWAALPSIACIYIIYYYAIESPRYQLICTDDTERAVNLIDYMGSTNTKDYQKISEDEKKKLLNWAQKEKNSQKSDQIGNYSRLFQGETRHITVLACIMWFSLSFVYYGISFILPQILIRMRKSEKDNLDSNSNVDFLGILLSVLVEFPSNHLAAHFIENKRFGRIYQIGYSYLITGICCLLAFFLKQPNNLFFFLISSAKFFINISFQVLYPFTTEIYITSLRAMGTGFTNACCRAGGILMPFIANVFFVFGNTGPLLSFSIIAFISAIAAFNVKTDTTDTNLDSYQELQSDPQEEKNKINQNNNNNNKYQDHELVK